MEKGSSSGVILSSVVGILFTVFAVGAMGYMAYRDFTYVPIPTKIDVNGTQWRVEVVGKLPTVPDNMGFIALTDCRVKVISLLDNGEKEQPRLLHEVLHAAVCEDAANDFNPNNMWYTCTSNDAHECVYRPAIMLSEIFRRNPDFAKWMGE